MERKFIDRNAAKVLHSCKVIFSFNNKCTIYYQKKSTSLVLPLTDHENGEERSLLEDRHNQLNEGKQT